MNRKIPLLFLFILLIADYQGNAFSQDVISDEDLQNLPGSWTGTLTYLDYTSNNPFSMPADINIVKIDIRRKYLFSNIFPEEPQANSADTVIISIDGSMINNEKVISKKYLQNGNTEIITEFKGVDGNESKPAFIRHTYTLGGDIFIIRKDVKFEDQSDWINRHEYNYKRSNPEK